MEGYFFWALKVTYWEMMDWKLTI